MSSLLGKTPTRRIGFALALLAIPSPVQAGGDPDGDGTRAQARAARPNEPINDELDPKKGDSVDWKVFDLPGAGLATVEINWDEETTDLNIALYGADGAELASSSVRNNVPVKRLLAQIDGPGKYYVKVSSARGATAYTMRLKWLEKSRGGGGAAPVPAPAVPAPAPTPAVPAPDDAMHPHARIIQSYRDDAGYLVLYLDKGSAAKVKPGMMGAVLEGDSEKPLEGATFQITKVVDANKSIARSSIARTGKNLRCVIHLVK